MPNPGAICAFGEFEDQFTTINNVSSKSKASACLNGNARLEAVLMYKNEITKEWMFVEEIEAYKQNEKSENISRNIIADKFNQSHILIS